MKIKINPKFDLNNHSSFFKCSFLILLLLTVSCSATKKLQKTKVKEYQNLIQSSSIFNQGFTGFQLYDPIENKILFLE